MGIADFIILAIIAVLAVAAVLYLKKNSGKGGCCGCSGGCSGCSGNCASKDLASRRTRLQVSIQKTQDDSSPKALEQALIGVPGVTMANVDPSGTNITITTNGTVNNARLMDAIHAAGYSAEL